MREGLQSEALETGAAVPESELPVVASPVTVAAKVDPVYSHDGVLTAVRNLLETVVVVVFLGTFAVQPSRIPSESMVPTLKVGDYVLVDKASFAPAGWLDRALLPTGAIRHGDLIVFHFPVDGDTTVVKRVIGLPGDRLHLHQGRVYLNGMALDEPYTMYVPGRANYYRDEFPSQREDPLDLVETDWWLALRKTPEGSDLMVPQGDYFVLGDNRNNSDDSRYWGFVPQASVMGRPLLVYFTARAREAAGARERLRAEWRSVHVPR